MLRRSRLQLAGVPFHLIQRGNNRVACFYADEDFSFYLEYLAQLSKRHHATVHAYVIKGVEPNKIFKFPPHF